MDILGSNKVGILEYKNKPTYQEAIDVLTSQGKFYINLGLCRIQAMLSFIENPQKKLKYIHVAGTNGKGSVCAMLSAILVQETVIQSSLSGSIEAKPLKIGLFTSPHVFEYTERIKINDVEIPKEVFAQKILDIVEFAQKKEIHLTEFEILTVLAFQYFAENNVDIVILETGLGGRLDATNIIENNICSIITQIDFDHTERLGNSIEEIAYEKAGIIKQNCSIVINNENAGFEIVKKIAQEKNAEIFELKEGQNFPMDNFALKGVYQKENLSLTLTAIGILRKRGFKISQEAITKGLHNVKHPCRFEYIKEENILIDGAHNSNGIKALRESLDYYFPNQKIKFIFGCLKNKEYSEMINNLFTPHDEIYFYHFNNKNACTYEELESVCQFISKPFSEFRKDNYTLTVICGSFYMIKELLFKMGIK